MDISLRVPPAEPKVVKASGKVLLPGQANCLMQVTEVHPLRNSEEKYDEHQQELFMRMLRNREGLGAPLKMKMELLAARKVGRLPFLESSHIMEDVLLGRDETIDFSDIFGGMENSEFHSQPHVVVERSLGIL